MDDEKMFVLIRHRYDTWRSIGAPARPYREVLEIKNPPVGKCGIVMHEVHVSGESTFTEWDSLERVCEVWDKTNHINDINYMYELRSSYLRFVRCYDAKPWFLALSYERILGDFTIPMGQLF